MTYFGCAEFDTSIKPLYVRYYSEDPTTRVWEIMSKISGSYGMVPHEAVVVAGFSLTASGHLRQNTEDQLQKVLPRQ